MQWGSHLCSVLSGSQCVDRRQHLLPFCSFSLSSGVRGDGNNSFLTPSRWLHGRMEALMDRRDRGWEGGKVLKEGREQEEAGGAAGRVTRVCVNDRRRAKRRERKEGSERDSGCQEERDRKARGGSEQRGWGDKEKSDRQTRLACQREVEEGYTDEGKEEEEGVNEGEFECVRQTWTEAIVGSWS